MESRAGREEVSAEEGAPLVRRAGLSRSFGNAGRGLIRTVSTQRNMKIHTVSAVMVMILGMALPFELASRMALLFCVALVLFAEILNTALEAFVDLHVKTFHRAAMAAKDAAAAGVLVLAMATVAILGAIIHFEWEVIVAEPESILRSVALGLPLTAGVSFLLWGARSTILRLLLSAAALALSVPLIAYGGDPIFSAGLLGLLLLSALSKPA